MAGTRSGGYSGDGGAATAAGLNLPYGAATAAGLNLPYRVAVDASGNIYIAVSTNNRIRLVADPSGP